MEAGFLQAYRAGRELYDLEAGVQRTARKLKHKRKRLADIELDMRDTGIELVTTGVTTERRVILLDELRKLEQARAATKAQIPLLEAEMERQTNRLATISSAHDY
jgi:biopolymer transport protein ExbB/TolQ